MWTTVAHAGTPKRCEEADGEVGAEVAGGGKQGEREGVGGHDGDGAGGVERGDGGAVVDDVAVGAGILEDGAEYFLSAQFGGGIAEHDGPAEGRGAGFEHGDGLRVAVAIDEEGGAGGFGGALGHGHGLGGGGCLIEQGRVGDVEAGQTRRPWSGS